MQKADKELIFYGVYNTRAELADGGDILCTVRQKFFESGKRQKNRSTFNISGEMIKASYTLEEGRPLKWKKLIGSRLAERVTIKEKCYFVESMDSERHVYKRAYFDYQHNWIYTDYFLSENSSSPDCTFAPYVDGDRPAVIVKTGNDVFETLYPFEKALDKELTEKLNDAAGEPRVLCRTSSGTFYFCTKVEAEDRQRALDRLLDEKIQAEQDMDEDELIEPGFEVDISAAEQSMKSSYQHEPQDDIYASSENENESDIDSISLAQMQTDTDADAEPEKEQEPAPVTALSDEEEKPLDIDDIIDTVPEPSAELQTSPDGQTAAFMPENIKDVKTSEQEKAEPEKDDIQEAEKHPQGLHDEMPVQEFAFTEDRLFEESRTGQEAAVSAETGEMCALAGQCPYENTDKLIIESGGRQYFYFGGTDGDSRHGSGRTVMFDGKTAYEGGYKDDKRHGFGTYYFKSGKLCYAGNWHENKREGLGAAFSSSDGSAYIGKWHENEPVSVGASFDREGRLIYVGKTSQGKRSGTGITYSEESDTFFVGKYRDGEFLGRGTQFDSEGNMLYAGGFSGGMRCGEGVSYMPDGSVRYKGMWKNDRYHGDGTLYLEDGCTLRGSFRRGRAEGKCTLCDASGRMIYNGGFSDDLYNGAGRLYSDDGSYCEGRFASGEPTGVFNEYDAQGQLVYCGEWTDMQRNGKGVEYRKGQKLYEGDFVSGVWNGSGKLYEEGELVYIGNFTDGKVSGFGREIDGDDIVYIGMWEDGSYNGCGILYENGSPKYAGSFRNGEKDGRINELINGRILRKCLFEKDKMTYMCEYSEDGSILYYGNVQDGKRSGMGCSFNAACEKEFEGIFRNGKPEKAMSVLYRELEELPVCTELEGTEYSSYSHSPEYAVELSYGGGIYTGQVHDGKPHGRGTVVYFDHRYTGMFSYGEPSGKGVIYMRDGSEIEGEFSPEPTPSCETLVFTNLTYYRLIK